MATQAKLITDQDLPDEAEGVRYAPTLHPEYPTAWWPVALSSDVAKGRAEPLRVLEKDLVLWRGEDGTLHCQAAHCPHLGAHFGHGGIVAGNSLQCPFHGMRFDGAGTLVGHLGISRPRQDICQPTYRIAEQYGLVFLWNGGGVPDYDIPDLYAEHGISKDEYFTIAHRYYLPFPAKWLIENVCDAMHIAFAHSAAETGEAIIEENTPVRFRVRNEFAGPREWWTWKNAKWLFQRRELLSLFTPIQGTTTTTSFGGTFHLTQMDDAGKFGYHGSGWTPHNVNDSYMFAIDLVPRSPIRALQSAWSKLFHFVARRGIYAAVCQDVALMQFRQEPAQPAYFSFDKALVAFRRYWDARIESPAKLSGDMARANGARAGLHSGKGGIVRDGQHGVSEEIVRGIPIPRSRANRPLGRLLGGLGRGNVPPGPGAVAVGNGFTYKYTTQNKGRGPNWPD